MSTDNPIASNVGVICGACQSVNKPDAKFCNGCGQPLYEKCPGCPQQVSLTQKFCDHCGADLDSARTEKQQKHKDWMTEAVAAAREYKFDRSLRLLSRVTENDDYRYADDVRNAKQAIEKVKALQSQAESSVEEALTRAKEAYDAGNQPLTAKLLATIPEPMMTGDIRKLLTKVQAFSDQLSALDEEMRSAIADKNWPLVGGFVDQLLNLVPGDVGYQQVARQVGEKLLNDSRVLLSKGRYGAAVDLLESIPTSAHSDAFKQVRDQADDLNWLSSQFEAEPLVTPMLGRLAMRFAKEVPEDPQAQQLVKQLAAKLKSGPREPKTQFPKWQASSDCWFGGQAKFLTLPESISLGDHPVIKTAPGRFFVAAGLAIQGLGQGRMEDQFVKKKGLLGGLSRRKKRVWGIDLGNGSMKAVCLEEVDGQLVVVDAFYHEYESPICRAGMEEQQSSILGSAINAFFQAKEESLEEAGIWVNIHASKLISRFVRLPPVKDKQAQNLLTQEADQKIPIPAEDLATVRWMAEFNEESVHGRAAVVTAARRHVIEDRISQLEALGLEVDGLQADTLALVNFLAYEFADVLPDVMDDETVHRDEAPAILLIDAGASATNLIVVSGESHWVWTMESGGEDMTGLIARATKKTLSDAEKLKRNPADLKHPARQYQLVEQRQDEVRARLETAFSDGMQQDGRFFIEQSFCCGGASMSHAWIRRLMLVGK